MKVQLIRDVKSIAGDAPRKEGDPIITKDGAKLVEVTVMGASPIAAVMGVFSSFLQSLEKLEADQVIYLYPGNIVSGVTEHRFTMVVGVSGVLDLDTRLRPMLKHDVFEKDKPVSAAVGADVGATAGAPTPVAVVTKSEVPTEGMPTS